MKKNIVQTLYLTENEQLTLKTLIDNTFADMQYMDKRESIYKAIKDIREQLNNPKEYMRTNKMSFKF